LRRLHLVGFTSELDGLIFGASDSDRSGSYIVELDDEVLAAVREVLARRDVRRSGTVGVPGRGVDPTHGLSGRSGSSLAPREIQARLRAGRSIGEVALEAGVDDEWVRRFAAPVFAEQTHIAGRALAAVLDDGDVPPSSASLHESVLSNLAGRGLVVTDDELSSAWSAFHVRDASWVVQLRAAIGRDEVVARWGFDTRSGALVALDPTAADLGWVDQLGRGRAAAVAATRQRGAVAGRPAANGGPATTTTEPRPETDRAAASAAREQRDPAPPTRRARPTEAAPASPPAEAPPSGQEALPLRVPRRPVAARRPPAPDR